MMIQSSVWRAAYAEGFAKGLAEAQLAMVWRDLCADLVRDMHPTIADRALPVVESCGDPATLKRWGLLAARGRRAAFH